MKYKITHIQGSDEVGRSVDEFYIQRGNLPFAKEYYYVDALRKILEDAGIEVKLESNYLGHP